MNLPNARQRILQAAVKVFAEKSFEGSRIDEIAKEAGAPKSLIYYHFKSKDEILEVLVSEYLIEFADLLKIAEKDTHQTKAGQMMDRMQFHYREFFIRNADLTRTILIESLKKSAAEPIIFKMVEALVDTEKKFGTLSEQPNYNRNERLVAEFFTNIIPGFAFLCFYKSWTEYFNINQEELGALFTRIMATTHGAYHQNHT